jgi:hypothetical protein
MTLIWRASDSGLEPSFRQTVGDFLSQSPFAWYVQMAFRSLEEQAELYARFKQGGPKAAPPGLSAHNYGLAIDIVLDRDDTMPGLQPTWDVQLPGWHWLFKALEFHPSLKSGVGFGDGGHIERRHWEAFKGWAAHPSTEHTP